MSEYPEYEVVDVYESLKDIISPDYLSVSLLERINNAVGIHAVGLKREQLPYAVVRPGCAQEVSELMKYANSKRIPVFVRGSGTSLCGASSYHHKGIVLNTSRLTHFNMVKENCFVEMGPGHRTLHIQEELEKEGYFLPMHPGSIVVATVGGIVSNNTSAHIVDPCKGKPRDYILGVQVVLCSGEILETGTTSLRRPAGIDLTQLFVGGDGLFGVITSVRLRLEPICKSAYGVAFFDDGIRAVRAVQRMYQERLSPPLFLEYLDKRSADAGFKVQGLEAPLGSVIIFQFIGQTEEEASSKRDRFLGIAEQENAVEAKEVDNLEYWDKLWTARSSVGPYAAQLGKGRIISAELVSPVENLLDCYEEAVRMGEDMPTLKKLNGNYLYGHLGALSFHPSFVTPADWSDEAKAKVISEVFLKEAEINAKYGTCGGEWGQGAMRMPFYRKRYGERNLQLVREMKRVFDPNNILNPDLLPEE